MPKKSKHLKTLTVGIPAFNEEKNIGRLLRALLKQDKDGIKIDRIIVSSDGSTDNTVGTIRAIKSPLIHVIKNKKRMGIARGLNQITHKTGSDILIVLNGDISIRNKDFLIKLAKPIIDGESDLTSCKVSELYNSNFVSRVLTLGAVYRSGVFEKYKKGMNLYTCHGQARAFSKRLYKSINFPFSYGEDMFSYLYAIKNGFKYAFVKNTEIFYRIPATLGDNRKQSVRYLHSVKIMKDFFGTGFVQNQNAWPAALCITEGLKMFIKAPLAAICYPFVFLYTFAVSNQKAVIGNTWELAGSSK